MKNFATDSKIGINTVATATGTTTITSAIEDSAGYDAVTFMTRLGSFDAGNYLKLQGGNAANGSDMADLAGSKVTPTADASAIIIGVEFSPAYRYYQLLVVRTGATSTIGDIWSVKTKNKTGPISNTGATALVKILNGAAAGTA